MQSNPVKFLIWPNCIFDLKIMKV